MKDQAEDNSRSGSESGSQLRIDYVSPLPPVRSGIADYSVDLLSSLEKLADVRVIQVPGQPVAEAVAARFSVVPASELDNKGRCPLYQMGNNLYHEVIRDLAIKRPGFMTLHDVWLHHLLMELTLGRQEITSYTVALVQDHGWIGGAASLPPRWGGYGKAAAFSLPVHRSLLERQWGIVVHSKWAAGVVEESLGEGPLRPQVRAVSMPMPVPEIGIGGRAAAAEYRQKLGIPLSAPVLGSFGFQTPIKRTEVVLRSLAEPGLEKVHLLIGGEVSKGLDLEKLARDLGVAERVRVTGFLAEEDFSTAISACDLCANLRYPTAGETSASLLRILALGRGAIVSDYAQFAELPAGGVVKVPLEAVSDGGEVAALARLLRDLFRTRDTVKRIGEEARRFVEQHHDPAIAARSLVEALGEMKEGRARLLEENEPATSPGTTLPDLTPRPTSLTWGNLAYRLRVNGAQAPWPVGERRHIEIELTNLGFARLLAAPKGPGGVALEVKLLSKDSLWRQDGGGPLGLENLRSNEPWLPLRVDLESGESSTFKLQVRRPPGSSWLRIEPQVMLGDGFKRSGAKPWERMLL